MNKLVLSLLWALALWITTGSLAVVSAEEYKFRLKLSKSVSIKPSSRIRVRIFPHTKNYKPHGRDTNMSQVKLISEANCRVYKGTSSYAGKSKQFLKETKSLALDANTMTHPLFIRCAKPVIVERAKNLTPFAYRGDVYARVVNRSDAKTLELINIVSLNEYLKGVVPSEVYSRWPMETLKTQAVAARTYAVFHLAFARRYIKRRLWDVDDTIAFQAYTGISLNTKRTNLAVEETKGQILTHDGDVIQAYYHADSGGQTEDAADVWDLEIPYVQGRKESFDFEVSDSAWRKTLNIRTVQSKLRRIGFLGRREKLVDLTVPVAGRTDSGRVRVVTLKLDGEKTRNIEIGMFKRASGNLPSTLFAFEKDPANPKVLHIKGLGSGHGVGMSQQGAAILASDKGWSYDQILDYYYTDTTLCRLGKGDKDLPNCYSEAMRISRKNKPEVNANAS
ncbi:SpoIID/LytB domain-containing protein [Pseudobacteriovorax antillogorgiicola]|uniref:Stage II sporulation protein D n=1 Tax=Pseudobacteriovorax antillogorgiicola TaxID=1513793 RepID=A0A1Y6BM22_9BACT|nr:SpoIID/LytB domain-containing protein [Pseudobacteriovorax antillogorgiicola]TCS56268.1 stage II sporulation protein D [Pseudobacteriovorax antillogorgiicola]SMF07806.1 stage II sporulation protein D [Pseudobacteriovorax antillogorgiicola]